MLAVMLAVVMMMGLGVTSMAATTEDSNKVTVHVTIQIQIMQVRISLKGMLLSIKIQPYTH